MPDFKYLLKVSIILTGSTFLQYTCHYQPKPKYLHNSSRELLSLEGPFNSTSLDVVLLKVSIKIS